MSEVFPIISSDMRVFFLSIAQRQSAKNKQKKTFIEIISAAQDILIIATMFQTQTDTIIQT